MALPNLRLIAVTTALLGAFAAGWVGQGWRMQSVIDRKELAHAKQLEAMHTQALADYKDMEDKKNAALKTAEARADKNRAAADAAAADLERLRGDLARVPARIQSATRAAVDQYAATAGELLGACSAEVAELARAADGHASDARLMREAWPVR